MNDLLNLPATPALDGPSSPEKKREKTSSHSFAPVSVSDIKDFISPKLYSELSWDENRSAEEVTEDCIEKAAALAETMLHLVDEKLNGFSKTQAEIIKTLTVYELYMYNGDRYRAKGYMEKAEKLISDRYRSIEKEREAAIPFIAVSKAEKGKGLKDIRICR